MRVRTLSVGALVAGGLLLTGCGSSWGTTPGASVSPSGSVPPSASASPAPSTPAVSALSFDLPTTPAYRSDGTRLSDDGAIVRTWRFRLPAAGGSCVVVAGEQPRFSGAFPAAALQAFGLGHEDGSELRYNERSPVIPGTTAGLRQSRTYRFSLGVRGTATGVVMVRQYLTTGGTLISLNVAGPADSEATCGLQGIVDSLRVASPGDEEPPLVLPTAAPSSTPTGTPTTTPTATPSATPSRTPSGTATRPSGAESTP